eukprot:scaffold13640_cov135-Skeletonema_marinoi.AAC.2
MQGKAKLISKRGSRRRSSYLLMFSGNFLGPNFSPSSYYSLSYLVSDVRGLGVEVKSTYGFLYNKDDGFEREEKKQLYHMEEAAIGGHPIARYNLGCVEGNKGRNERAMKHFIIVLPISDLIVQSKAQGEYASGNISKEDFATALRAHHAAVNATTSPQREAAAAKEVTK